MDSQSKKPLNELDIQKWLAQQIAHLAEIDVGQIEFDQPFSVYGLTSAQGISITADLEDTYGIKVPPTALWDYPSIQALAQFLVTQDSKK